MIVAESVNRAVIISNVQKWFLIYTKVEGMHYCFPYEEGVAWRGFILAGAFVFASIAIASPCDIISRPRPMVLLASIGLLLL